MHMTRSHPDKNFILGIDVGTSGCKVLLADKAGTVRASAVEPYPLTQPRPGWTERDPRLWWNACCAACRRVLNAGVCDGSDIAAVGLTGQMHSLVALDERMDPIRPAILWNDQRTTAQCREIRQHTRRGADSRRQRHHYRAGLPRRACYSQLRRYPAAQSRHQYPIQRRTLCPQRAVHDLPRG